MATLFQYRGTYSLCGPPAITFKTLTVVVEGAFTIVGCLTRAVLLFSEAFAPAKCVENPRHIGQQGGGK